MIIHIFNSSIVSGPETLTLPALKKINREIAIIFLNELRLGDRCKAPIEYAKGLGHTVYSIDVRGRWDRQAFHTLRMLLDSLSPKIVHSHDVKASLYLLKAKKSKPAFQAKIISTHHGAAARKGLIRIYEEFYVRRILPHFDAICCVCDYDKKSLLRRGIKESLIYIHHNGINGNYIAPENRNIAQQEIRKKWQKINPSLPQNTFYLGAIARLSPEKRHDRMIHVVKIANDILKDKKISLLFFGSGPLEEKLKAYSSKLNATVYWMGYSKTISQETAGFDLLLCMSYGEGIPINLLEAGWSGTPIFSTRVGGIPDIAPSEEYGFLVDYKESDENIAKKLAKILEYEPQLKTIGEAYQKRIMEQFSETAWLQRLQEIYAHINQ